jgi:hypothetical protein
MATKSRRKALGGSWADAYSTPVQEETKVEVTPKESTPSKSPEPKNTKSETPKEAKPEETKQKKVRAVFYLPENLLQEARNSVVHLAGYPEYLNLTKLAENAISCELKKLKKKHMDGNDFPAVLNGPLKGGRPIGT